jgi:hypothetical protein
MNDDAKKEPPLVFRTELAADAAVAKCQAAETRADVKWQAEWSRWGEGFVVVARVHGCLFDIL